MTASVRLAVTLATLMIATASSISAQSLSSPASDDGNPSVKVRRSDEQSECFFNNDAACNSGATPPERMFSVESEFSELMPHWFELFTERSRVGTSMEPLVPRSPEFTILQPRTIQQVLYRVPLNYRLEWQTQIHRDRLDTSGYREDRIYSEGEFEFPYGAMWTLDNNIESFPAKDQDYLIPHVVPDGQPGYENTAIDEIITTRYQNPITARVIRRINASEVIQLFAEVSQMNWLGSALKFASTLKVCSSLSTCGVVRQQKRELNRATVSIADK